MSHQPQAADIDLFEWHYLISHCPYKTAHQRKCTNKSGDAHEQPATETMPSFNILFH